jgi:hypothetical protein
LDDGDSQRSAVIHHPVLRMTRPVEVVAALLLPVVGEFLSDHLLHQDRDQLDHQILRMNCHPAYPVHHHH